MISHSRFVQHLFLQHFLLTIRTTFISSPPHSRHNTTLNLSSPPLPLEHHYMSYWIVTSYQSASSYPSCLTSTLRYYHTTTWLPIPQYTIPRCSSLATSSPSLTIEPFTHYSQCPSTPPSSVSSMSTSPLRFDILPLPYQYPL